VVGVIADSLTAGIIYLLILGNNEKNKQSFALRAAALIGGLFYSALSTSIIPAVGGLETAFFTLSVASFFLALQYRLTYWATAFGLLTVFLRPEGGLIIGIFILKCAWEFYNNKKGELISLMFLVILTLVIYALSLLYYFGTLLPQTALAKSLTRGDSSTWMALLKPLYFSLATAPLAILSLVGIVYLLKNRLDIYLLFAWTIGYISLISIFGAWWPWYKPPVMIFYSISIGVGLNWIFLSIRRFLAEQYVVTFAAVLGILLFLGACFKTIYTVKLLSSDQESQIKFIANWVTLNVSHDKIIMLEPLGVFGYYVPHKIYDYPGLASSQVTDALKKYILLVVAVVRRMSECFPLY
jgi:hypothetical protein